jgi:hypothetical protein
LRIFSNPTKKVIKKRIVYVDKTQNSLGASKR